MMLIGTSRESALCLLRLRSSSGRDPGAARQHAIWDCARSRSRHNRVDILPPGVTARVSVEMGSAIGWDRYAGAGGAKIGMTTFGASAPLKDLLAEFGFTSANVVAAAKEQIAKSKGTTS